MRRLSCVVAAGLLGILSTATAQATIVERVVAVIGERAILLSDVKERSRPYLVRIHNDVPPGAQRAAAISQVYKMMLTKMVDEQLEQRAANRAQIVVDAAEVDQAMARVAAQNNVSVERLIDEARRSGLDERQYRDELRRQLLQAKLVNLRLQGRIRVSDSDVERAYRKLVLEERNKLKFQAAKIVIQLPNTDDKSELTSRRALSEQIAAQAQAGADFAELARRYSQDPETRANGGLLAPTMPGQLARQLDRVALSLEAGETSRPIRIGNRLVILKLVERQASSLPSFEQARTELRQHVYLEKLNTARERWLESLRRQTHVEIRL